VKSKALKSEALLFLASAIWGFAFVAQRVGMDYVGPFIYNGIRFALGSLVLLPFLLAGKNRANHRAVNPAVSAPKKFLRYGLPLGLILFCGASLQQIGLVYTTAGKAGFITGLYVIIVPIIGLLWRQRPGLGTWLGALLAAVGLYLLSFSGSVAVSKGDLLVLAGAFFWAGHVQFVGWVSSRIDTIGLAISQFLICSVLSLITALLVETTTLTGILQAAIPILYGGLLSVGLAYTLQIIAQRNSPPAHTAIILSLETVFAALGGWLILDETLPLRGLFGCGLMLAGILISRLGSAINKTTRHTDEINQTTE
jgi:drug/metabolite transporter (DMT)-like permease